MNKLCWLISIFVIGLLLYIMLFRSTREGLSHQSKIHEISILSNTNGYSPKTINIKVGDTVAWTNDDSIEHTVTHKNGEFDSGAISSGGTFSYKFLQKEIYNYYCTIHPWISGVINVI